MTNVSKEAPQSEQSRQAGPKKTTTNLPVWLKVVLSLLFAFHLLGVFIAPLNMSIGSAIDLDLQRARPLPEEPESIIQQTAYQVADYRGRETVYVAQVGEGGESLPPATAPDSNAETEEAEAPSLSLYELYTPYLNLLYLNHGYGFFSPDPAPSHIIRFRIEPHNGTEFEGVFPNLTAENHPALKEGAKPEVHWPRLRYHRHFMLAEQLIEPSFDPNPDPNEVKIPVFSGKTYAAHLFRIHHAKRVHLDYIEHRLLTPEESRGGKPLDDPDTYEVMQTLTYPDDFPDAVKALAGEST